MKRLFFIIFLLSFGCTTSYNHLIIKKTPTDNPSISIFVNSDDELSKYLGLSDNSRYVHNYIENIFIKNEIQIVGTSTESAKYSGNIFDTTATHVFVFNSRNKQFKLYEKRNLIAKGIFNSEDKWRDEIPLLLWETGLKKDLPNRLKSYASQDTNK